MYDYYEAVESDVRQWLDEQTEETIREFDADTLRDRLYDSWVTGNDGNFYADEEICKEYVADNLELVFDALYEFDYSIRDVRRRSSNDTIAQFLETMTRCYVLDECVDNVCYERNIPFEKDDEETETDE